MTALAHRVLIQFAHPALQKSRVNRELVREVRGLAGVTFRDLYELYPEFDIDVGAEQALLAANDIVVFQHPLYWYSTPAILKEWQDLVLEHGWAYGEHGTALRGKKLLSAITTGGRENAYCSTGGNRFTILELLAPIEQTACLCGMEFLPPFVVHGTHEMPPERIRDHARDYRRAIEALRDGTIDLEAAHGQARLNANLDAILRK